MQKHLIPLEWVCATLAALTIPLFIYVKLPIWATFVTWAGAFLVGPNMDGVKKLFPTLILGSLSGVLFFSVAFKFDPLIGSALIGNIIIVFLLTLALLYLSRISIFSLAPGIFFGFACYVGVALTAQVSTIPALFAPWVYATGALLLGPPLAWLSIALTFQYEVPVTADNPVAAGKTAQSELPVDLATGSQ